MQEPWFEPEIFSVEKLLIKIFARIQQNSKDNDFLKKKSKIRVEISNKKSTFRLITQNFEYLTEYPLKSSR